MTKEEKEIQKTLGTYSQVIFARYLKLIAQSATLHHKAEKIHHKADEIREKAMIMYFKKYLPSVEKF
jgi:hypothetical protein